MALRPFLSIPKNLREWTKWCQDTIATEAQAASADDATLLNGQSGAYYLALANATGTLDESKIAASIARDSEVTAAITAHEAASDPHTGYQKESEKNASSGYAGLNSSSRTTKGVDTTDDLIIDLATKGLVLKDTASPAHYWRISVSTLGVLTTTDLGTTKP